MFAFSIYSVIGSGLNISLIESPWRVLNEGPFYLSKSESEGNTVLDFRSICLTFTTFQRALWNKIKEGKKRNRNEKSNMSDCRPFGDNYHICLGPFWGQTARLWCENWYPQRVITSWDISKSQRCWGGASQGNMQSEEWDVSARLLIYRTWGHDKRRVREEKN